MQIVELIKSWTVWYRNLARANFAIQPEEGEVYVVNEVVDPEQHDMTVYLTSEGKFYNYLGSCVVDQIEVDPRNLHDDFETALYGGKPREEMKILGINPHLVHQGAKVETMAEINALAKNIRHLKEVA